MKGWVSKTEFWTQNLEEFFRDFFSKGNSYYDSSSRASAGQVPLKLRKTHRRPPWSICLPSACSQHHVKHLMFWNSHFTTKLCYMVGAVMKIPLTFDPTPSKCFMEVYPPPCLAGAGLSRTPREIWAQTPVRSKDITLKRCSPAWVTSSGSPQ